LFREKLRLDSDYTILGAVSRLDQVKDHKTLINAFSNISKKWNKCVLIIVGDGPEKPNIIRQIEKLGLKNKVFLLGFIHEVERFLPSIDLFLQPSIYEGLSLTILEAAAAGIPIVSTPVGGTPEIITNKHEGVLVEPGNADALTKAIDNYMISPQEYKEMANNIKQKVYANFSLQTMNRNYENVYYRLLHATD